jgi:hypothetical protein
MGTLSCAIWLIDGESGGLKDDFDRRTGTLRIVTSVDESPGSVI